MTDLDSLTAESSNPSPPAQSKWFVLLVTWMPAIIGLVGVLVGGLITAGAQYYIAKTRIRRQLRAR